LSEKHFLKLRGAVAGRGKTLGALADELTLSAQGLSNKLSGRSDFTLGEMLQTCNFLDSQIDIFFDPELHDLQFLQVSRTA